VLDDRLGLLVVDLEPPRDRLGRVVAAALLLRAAEQALDGDAVGQVEPFRTWRLDDESLAFPLIERALEHGLKTIAIHKAAPLGPVPTVLGLIPLTSPVTMPMRMASTPVPPVEIAVSLVLLFAGIAGAAWVAGKVYRVGILSTGKRVTLAELVRWVRAA